jgi:hypothetical protein
MERLLTYRSNNILFKIIYLCRLSLCSFFSRKQVEPFLHYYLLNEWIRNSTVCLQRSLKAIRLNTRVVIEVNMKKVLLLLVVSSLLVACPSVFAGTIAYSVTDRSLDLGAGYFQYDYSVQGFSFLADQGFQIFFPYASTEDLQPLPGTPTGWDVIAMQPDPSIPDKGIYDALALVNNPSLSGKFSLTFKYLGSGTPGAQGFEVYDLNDLNSPLFSGQTQGVPEPGIMTLLGIGLASVLIVRRKMKS